MYLNIPTYLGSRQNLATSVGLWRPNSPFVKLNRDAPGDGTQVGRFEGVEEGGEGTFQTHKWPLLDNPTGAGQTRLTWSENLSCKYLQYRHN